MCIRVWLLIICSIGYYGNTFCKDNDKTQLYNILEKINSYYYRGIDEVSYELRGYYYEPHNRTPIDSSISKYSIFNKCIIGISDEFTQFNNNHYSIAIFSETKEIFISKCSNALNQQSLIKHIESISNDTSLICKINRNNSTLKVRLYSNDSPSNYMEIICNDSGQLNKIIIYMNEVTVNSTVYKIEYIFQNQKITAAEKVIQRKYQLENYVTINGKEVQLSSNFKSFKLINNIQ